MAHLGPDVAGVVALFEQSDLLELTVERAGWRLFLRRGDGLAAAPAPEVEAPSEPPPAIPIKAHMVGVFYWSKDKGAKPAVALQQRIEKGQVIGFIEAMDIMNEVEAAHAGTVAEVAASSGQAVEYGQTLVLLQTARTEAEGS